MPNICSHEEIIEAVYTACSGSKWNHNSEKHNNGDEWYTRLEWLQYYHDKLSKWSDKEIEDHNDCYDDMPYDKIMDAIRIEMTAIKIVGEPPEGTMSLVYTTVVKNRAQVNNVNFRLEYPLERLNAD